MQKNSPESWELAQKLQNEIDITHMAASDTKSTMLIMYRGMDLVAPLVHDITFQVRVRTRVLCHREPFDSKNSQKL